MPTPHPGNTEWVRERLDAIVALYQPAPAGEALLHSLDVRQMPGEPGFFGSYGFDGWAGVGEAKPIPIMHELGHSYWGAFPVIGRPGLDWQLREGDTIAPALAAYHRDILAFMEQPPDEYEILRQRLRDLPGLFIENTEPLFHSLEADVPHITGGDLALVPPILRKYWGHFLIEGPYGSWQNAAGWFQSLSPDERTTAEKFLGFEHLDLRQYTGLPAYSPGDNLLPDAAETLAREERQRLTDLVEQFDLLIGDAQLEENFQFWRGYLQDKVALYRLYPDHIESLSLPRTGDLSDALAFLSSMDGSPEHRASTLSERIADRPFLVNFLPAVDDHTLVKLFASEPDLPEGPTLQATASFVERLQRFAGLVEMVLSEGRKSPELGARALTAFLDDTGSENEQDLKLFFDLFHGTDRALGRQIMTELDKDTIQSLMGPVPTQLRAIFQPQGLLDKLDITEAAPEGDLLSGITLLIEEASGNYRIDEPFLKRLYEVMAVRAQGDPGEVIRIIAGTPFALEGFVLHQPAASSAVLSSDTGMAVRLVLGGDPVLSPPARLIYRLIWADPSLAAALVVAFDQLGERELVAESLVYFAYDKVRSEQFPQLPISLSQDGALLRHLLDRQGVEWLEDRLAAAISLYRQRVETGDVSPGFLVQYKETLEAAAFLSEGESGVLASIIVRAFREV